MTGKLEQRVFIFQGSSTFNLLKICIRINQMNQIQPYNGENEAFMTDIPGLSISLGITKTIYINDTRVISHMPISLYPYVIKMQIYNKLKKAHSVWQKLFVLVSKDQEFVASIADKLTLEDQFMSNFYNIYKRTNRKDKSSVCCSRIDYMGDSTPKLVQFNLMSVGLNGISDRVQALHQNLGFYSRKYPSRFVYPQNRNQLTLCQALIKCLQIECLLDGLILMVVHEKQFNYGDHHAFKLELIRQGRRAESVTMEKLIEKMEFDQKSEIAYLDGVRIDAFYFRTGYGVNHFPTQSHWNIRQKIQRSKSIKLPSIDMIIVNSKRFQCELAKQKTLDKFLSKQQKQLILELSGQIHEFDTKTESQIKQLLQKVRKEDYVLKPNREGGGHNFFGKQAQVKMQQILSERGHLNNFILMKKIKSESFSNFFFFDHKYFFVEKTTAQLSTLGCFIYKNGEILYNEMGGTLARLKRQEVNEGGIAINQGVVSGICIDKQAS